MINVLRNLWWKLVVGAGTCRECPYYVPRQRLIEWERALQTWQREKDAQ